MLLALFFVAAQNALLGVPKYAAAAARRAPCLKPKSPVLKALLKADSHWFVSLPLSLKRSIDDPSKLNNSASGDRFQVTGNRINFRPAAFGDKNPTYLPAIPSSPDYANGVNPLGQAEATVPGFLGKARSALLTWHLSPGT